MPRKDAPKAVEKEGSACLAERMTTAPKAVKLLGSCHCKAVKFSLMSHTPCPYTHCYCGLCRKINGGIGGAIAITGAAKTFDVVGAEHLSVYRPQVETEPGKVETMEAWRNFCKICGSHLWTWAPSRPDEINPFASAIDSDLPQPPERHHIFLKDKKEWVCVPPADQHHKHFQEFAELSPPEWHKTQKVYHE